MTGATKQKLAGAVTALLFSSLPQAGEFDALEKQLDVNPLENCQEAVQLYQDGDLKGAIDLVSLCKDEMEQIKRNLSATSFRDEVMGFTGGELSQGGAMGFSQIERTYTRGDSSIQVTLSSGGGAAMMQMAMGFAGRKVRVGRNTGTLVEEGEEITLFVNHDAGSFTFVTRSLGAKELKRFAREFLKDFRS